MYGAKLLFTRWHVTRDGLSTGQTYDTYAEAHHHAVELNIVAREATRPARAGRRQTSEERPNTGGWGQSRSKRRGLR